MELFFEIHSGLPREGPGDDASTRKAFSMVPSLPASPLILDIGCGPGMQTLELSPPERRTHHRAGLPPSVPPSIERERCYGGAFRAHPVPWYGYVFYIMKVPASDDVPGRLDISLRVKYISTDFDEKRTTE